LIFAPSYTYQEKRVPEDTVFLNWENKPLMDEEVFERMKNKSYLFTSRSNYIWHWDKSYKVFALEFNPFHPLALPFIQTYEDDGEVISGTYKWGRRKRDFYFHRNSCRYRLHYETWGALFGFKNYYMAIFDLVSNFDLRELELFSTPTKVYNFKPRFIVEGYFPAKTDGFHSTISAPRRNQLKGQDVICTYYSSLPVIIDSIGKKYLDVTEDYELRYYNMSKWELFVSDKRTGQTVVSLIYTEKKKYAETDR